jgi:cytochrome b subunit of formate dehydrogenase
MEKKNASTENYKRFHVLHRLLHIIIIFNFTLLALTGFVLHFSGAGWAKALVSLVGGAGVAGWLHRFCAVCLYLGILIHVAWLFYLKLILKKQLTGPDSILPGKKDLQDLVQNFRYFFNKGTPPLFDRYSYLQKVDYWAVMLGMQSMGITGLLMWFPEFFTGFLPGYFINVASHFHFHEAVLAVMYIGLVHMSDTHLVPDIFPLEKTIFTGRIEKKRFMEDHPEEWKRQQAIKN